MRSRRSARGSHASTVAGPAGPGGDHPRRRLAVHQPSAQARSSAWQRRRIALCARHPRRTRSVVRLARCPRLTATGRFPPRCALVSRRGYHAVRGGLSKAAGGPGLPVGRPARPRRPCSGLSASSCSPCCRVRRRAGRGRTGHRSRVAPANSRYRTGICLRVGMPAPRERAVRFRGPSSPRRRLPRRPDHRSPVPRPGRAPPGGARADREPGPPPPGGARADSEPDHQREPVEPSHLERSSRGPRKVRRLQQRDTRVSAGYGSRG